MSKRTPENLLLDIKDSADKINTYISGLSYDDFVLQSIVIDAVIRNIEIIGEAANRLPEDFKDAHPQIEWHKLRGLRNRVVHHYFGIDYEIIWDVIINFIPQMSTGINLMLENL